MNKICRYVGLGIAGSLMVVSLQAVGGIIFQDNFDNQPDYVGDDYLASGQHTLWAVDGDKVPQGWSAISLWTYNRASNPSFLQITSANSDKAYGGKGKSLVIRRFSGSVAWSGDAELAKNFEPGYDSLYVSFEIKFQPGWTPSGESKIFRIGHYAPGTRGSSYWSALNMGVLWEYLAYPTTASGLRNYLNLNSLHAPGEKNFANPTIKDHYTNLIDGMGISNSFIRSPYHLKGNSAVDNQPGLIDKQTGAVIPDGGVTGSHAMVFGDGWNKMAFYVKLNSAPGKQDGQLKEWMNGKLIFSNDTIPWIQAGQDPTAKFNAVKFGGNDFWQTYPASEQVTQWYSIDNVVMRTDIPAGLLTEGSLLPQSPKGLQVQ